MEQNEKENIAREIAGMMTDLMLIKGIRYNKQHIIIEGEVYSHVTPEAVANRLVNRGIKGSLKVFGEDLEIKIDLKTDILSRIPLVNISLFVGTVFTTVSAGAIMEGMNPLSVSGIIAGLPFSITLLGILLFHEFGHYFASVRNNVKASLPYFIPAPTFIGTFGAFIKMKSPIMTRKSLMEIGAAGPIAGFLVAVPSLYFGLLNSEVAQAVSGEGIHLGDSLIMLLLTKVAVPFVPEGYDIYLNSVAFAGWIGLLVTALNLLPIGQLDGGHIAYSLFGKKHEFIAKWAFFAMIPLGLLSKNMNWLLWAALIFFFIRLKHPPVMDEDEPLKPFHRWLGYISIIIFIITFIPVPFS